MVEDSFDPFRSEVVSNDPDFEMMESRIFYLILEAVNYLWNKTLSSMPDNCGFIIIYTALMM